MVVVILIYWMLNHFQLERNGLVEMCLVCVCVCVCMCMCCVVSECESKCKCEQKETE